MEGRYCDKNPTKYDWLGHPIWLDEDGTPIDACPEDMAEIDDGSACVKKYFEPELENPSCQEGFVTDVITAPKCKRECAPGYLAHSGFCYSVCPKELRQCGGLCVEQDFYCTEEHISLSTKFLGNSSSYSKQTKLVMDKEAPVCDIDLDSPKSDD